MNKFILPEKWFIERTFDNAEIVNKWICDQRGKSNSAFLTQKTIVLSNSDYSSYPKPKYTDGYTQITFKQFLDHIINKKPIIEDNSELNQILIKLLTE